MTIAVKKNLKTDLMNPYRPINGVENTCLTIKTIVMTTSLNA
ncbi:hypothetical protein BTN50_1624 (plasmid) [Candidatus Enterovibrio altilux]|uniref:Uncharacterized protein n=1 Tax=Candidatus Enterovibrio altilux TaxID=1927128 RepID=A0A291BAQ7_9GAMM|nr:hypothetical protein BTN50_1624 [Candidatus Enterovibrio luxaltus]